VQIKFRNLLFLSILHFEVKNPLIFYLGAELVFEDPNLSSKTAGTLFLVSEAGGCRTYV